MDKYRGKVFNCSEYAKLGSFSLRFGGYWIQVDSQDMLINLGEGDCALGLEGHAFDYWILGFSFMRNYYTSLDYETKTIQMAALNGSKKPKIAMT